MKKVLSFVLVLTLVLGSFSMVFAADANATTKLSDIAGNTNEQAITVVNDLGIVTGYPDGTFKSGNSVTRAEFAAMITRALAIPESALAGYTATTFKDTTGYGWAVPYLAFCESKGIMLGDGNGNAMPGKTITVNEAMTMILRALGLTNNSAFLVGSWPANYVTVAKNEGLYDDVAALSTVDRGSAAQIIYNALTVEGFAVNTDGETKRTTASLLNALNCTSHDELVRYNDDSLISLTQYVGAWATVYRNDDGEIVAVDMISEFLTGDFNAKGTEFEGDDDVTYNVDAFTSAAGITNAAIFADTYANNAAVGHKTDVTIAAEVTGKTITKLYSVATWTVDAYDQAPADVQDEIKDDEKLLGIDFKLDKSKKIDLTKFSLLGASDLSKIKEDDVVYVYAYDNNPANEIVKIEVGTKTVEGKITKVYTDDSTTYYVINGDSYAFAAEFGGTVPVAGDAGTATLNYAGDIYKWEADTATSENYAVVTGKYQQNGRDDTIVLLDKSGNEKEYVVKDSAKASAAAFTTKGALVTFGLDKNGKLDEITDVTVTTPALCNNVKVSKDGSVIGTTIVKKSVVVFVVDGSDYSVGKIADIDTDDPVTLSAIAVDTKGKISALLIGDNYLGNDASYGIITKSDATGLNADGDKVQLLDVFVDGKAMKDVVTDDLNETATASTGALLKIEINSDGVITKVSAHGLTEGDVVDETAATVSAIDGKVITCTDNNSSSSYRLADNVVLYVWNSDDEEWQIKSTLSSLRKKHVTLYDTDDDTTGFDVVLAY